MKLKTKKIRLIEKTGKFINLEIKERLQRKKTITTKN